MKHGKCRVKRDGQNEETTAEISRVNEPALRVTRRSRRKDPIFPTPSQLRTGSEGFAMPFPGDESPDDEANECDARNHGQQGQYTNRKHTMLPCYGMATASCSPWYARAGMWLRIETLTQEMEAGRDMCAGRRKDAAAAAAAAAACSLQKYSLDMVGDDARIVSVVAGPDLITKRSPRGRKPDVPERGAVLPLGAEWSRSIVDDAAGRFAVKGPSFVLISDDIRRLVMHAQTIRGSVCIERCIRRRSYAFQHTSGRKRCQRLCMKLAYMASRYDNTTEELSVIASAIALYGVRSRYDFFWRRHDWFFTTRLRLLCFLLASERASFLMHFVPFVLHYNVEEAEDQRRFTDSNVEDRQFCRSPDN
nr:hypothetical protein CFP56_69456 [Quercus suber]